MIYLDLGENSVVIENSYDVSESDVLTLTFKNVGTEEVKTFDVSPTDVTDRFFNLVFTVTDLANEDLTIDKVYLGNGRTFITLENSVDEVVYRDICKVYFKDTTEESFELSDNKKTFIYGEGN